MDQHHLPGQSGKKSDRKHPLGPPSPSPRNGGETGGQFQPGHDLGVATRFQPGNPGGPGRPAGVKELIRERTNNGRDIVEFLVKGMRDELYPKRRLRPADRIDCARILCERFWGRVPLADGDNEMPKLIAVYLKPGQDW